MSRTVGGSASSLRGPVHRSILAIDIEGSTRCTNMVKFEQRRQIYRLLHTAMEAAGIQPEHHEPLTDRGDGVLVLIHAVDEVPRSRLLNPLMPVLARLLTEYNEALDPEERMLRRLRLRAVVHAGDLLHDDYGPFGAELDAAFRLLDAPAVKARLRDTSAFLVLVVSGQIYESVVLHCHEGIRPESYRKAVRVEICGLRRWGWVSIPVPDDTVCHQENREIAACKTGELIRGSRFVRDSAGEGRGGLGSTRTGRSASA